MTLWKRLPPGRDPPAFVNVMIETPRGSKNKYEISKEFDIIRLDRVLHSSVMYPLTYGLIPGTYYDDKDPVDAMVMISEPTFPGCVIESRPLGILKMVDEAGKDDKILTVAEGDPTYADYSELEDMPQHTLTEIIEFFETYKRLEEDKQTEVIGWEGKQKAYQAIMGAIDSFNRKFADSG